MHPLPVLLTRPRADSERLAARLRAGGAGWVEIAPLMEIVPLALPDVPDGEGVLLTSANAVAALLAGGGAGGGRRAWVVGPRTAARAREAGFDVQATAPDAATLARVVPSDAPPLVHLRGAEARGDLAGALRLRGLGARDQVIYRQDPRPLLAEALRLVGAGPVLAPLYSPRAAALLMAAVPASHRANLRPVCLSRAVASACEMPPLAVAARPDGEAMIAAILGNLVPLAG